MYANELAKILSGMPHDTVVVVQGDNPIQRRGIEKVEVYTKPTTLEVVIVPIGARK